MYKAGVGYQCEGLTSASLLNRIMAADTLSQPVPQLVVSLVASSLLCRQASLLCCGPVVACTGWLLWSVLDLSPPPCSRQRLGCAAAAAQLPPPSSALVCHQCHKVLRCQAAALAAEDGVCFSTTGGA